MASSTDTNIPRSMQGITLVQVQDRVYRIPTASLQRGRQSSKAVSEIHDDETDTIYTEEIVTYYHPVNRTFHGILIALGRGGSTLKQLKIETGARIDICNGKDSVMIKGTQDKVDKAKEAIDRVIKKAYDTSRPTHFLSFPIISNVATRKLEEFQASILSSTFKCDGLDSSILVLPVNLHITLGVFKLLSQAEIEKAVRFLKQECPKVVEDILQKKRLTIRLRNLMSMQANPVKTNVLYIAAEDETDNNCLDALCAALINKMVEGGFLEKEDRPFKMHITLINTKYRSSQNGDQEEELERQPIDARPILKAYGDLDLGTVHIEKLHIMKMGHNGPGGTYISEGSIRL
ncbi:activating signal cointegrator 1 complex subunit [Apophysomyces ossiformis]|uniref:Activating signal cointegrator 1 complex subunit n=1 Tax=Apophysomyces ossiformis TaxID=679940 RepID=A0A8H7BW01_9FUNG|nr:activating signal cointegrator 1 complex subunit [Apophysomyces ossiformis]